MNMRSYIRLILIINRTDGLQSVETLQINIKNDTMKPALTCDNMRQTTISFQLFLFTHASNPRQGMCVLMNYFFCDTCDKHHCDTCDYFFSTISFQSWHQPMARHVRSHESFLLWHTRHTIICLFSHLTMTFLKGYLDCSSWMVMLWTREEYIPLTHLSTLKGWSSRAQKTKLQFKNKRHRQLCWG